MNRAQLEHVIRASAAISGDDEIVVIGSQSILGQFPAAPPELCASNEADVYPKNKPEMADVIDGAIGELSMFHDAFGYYAQGVAPETATLPRGWESRLIPVNNANTRGTRDGASMSTTSYSRNTPPVERRIISLPPAHFGTTSCSATSYCAAS